MQQVLLAASGGGTGGTLTKECEDALKNASCIIGARRLIEGLSEEYTKNRIPAIYPKEIVNAIRRFPDGSVVVLFSGDTGFYSGVRSLTPLLLQEGIPFLVYPGISSVQLLSAALARPWQDWRLCSAHGVDCNPVGEVMQEKPVFFLTGGSLGPAALCQKLTDAGLGALPVTVGENLSYPDEQIRTGTAEAFAKEAFSPLSVMLSEPAPNVERRAFGFPDSLFIRGEVPMTKREVRAMILSLLSPKPGDILWDVGAGTGSVSVELALAASFGQTYGVECKEEALQLMKQNREKFGAWNLTVVPGLAPEALTSLPAPDAVFIGGTKGSMETTVEQILSKNPKARICISAICIETAYQAMQALSARGISPSITQIGVSRGKKAGSLHLMMANNPIFLIAGNCDD